MGWKEKDLVLVAIWIGERKRGVSWNLTGEGINGHNRWEK